MRRPPPRSLVRSPRHRHAGAQPPPGPRQFTYEQTGEPFSFSVTRVDPAAGAPAPGRTLFNTTGTPRLVFKVRCREAGCELRNRQLASLAGADRRRVEALRRPACRFGAGMFRGIYGARM